MVEDRLVVVLVGEHRQVSLSVIDVYLYYWTMWLTLDLHCETLYVSFSNKGPFSWCIHFFVELHAVCLMVCWHFLRKQNYVGVLFNTHKESLFRKKEDNKHAPPLPWTILEHMSSTLGRYPKNTLSPFWGQWYHLIILSPKGDVGIWRESFWDGKPCLE